MENSLTLIFSYRNREPERVKRCLNSLANQTEKDFKVFFLDYGTESELAIEIKTLVESFDFCRYIYNDTRGQFWNRSHALNSAIRLVETNYYATTDIDLCFKSNFIETVKSKMNPKKFLHSLVYYLEEGFNDYENVWTMDKSHLEVSLKESHHGGFQLVPTEVGKAIGGFDEFYRIWGFEDNDLNIRLKKYGLEEDWIDLHESYTVHMWHPTKSSQIEFSRSWYAVMQDYFDSDLPLKRNGENWGRIVPTHERKLLETKVEPVAFVNRSYPADHDVIYDFHSLSQQLYKLSPGEAMKIEILNKTPVPSFFDRLNNSLQFRFGMALKFDRKRYDGRKTDYYSAARNLFWIVLEGVEFGLVQDYTIDIQEGVSSLMLMRR